jgi:hypothetical protein
MNWQAVLLAMAPENLLLAGIVLLPAFEIASRRTRDGFWIALVAALAAVLAALWLFVDGYSAAPFAGQFSVDPTTALSKGALIALTLPVLLISRDDFRESRYYVLLLSSLYGACLLVSADSFLTLFLGIEIMSLPVYVLVLVAFQRPESAGRAQVPGARRHGHRDPADGRFAAVWHDRLAGTECLRRGTVIGRPTGRGRYRAGSGRVVPQGRRGALPCLGARRI